MSRQQPQPDREQELDNREEAQAHQQAGGAAVEQALRERDLDREQFLDKIRDLGIEGEDGDRLKEEFGPEMAGVYAIANEDEMDYVRHKWLNRNKRERAVSGRSPGRLCTGPFLELARGTNNRQTGPEQPLSQRERKKVREMFEAKQAMHSLGKDGEGLSAVSEITAVTEHRRQTEPDDESSSSGIIGRIFS
jgi:hypothetical protein